MAKLAHPDDHRGLILMYHRVRLCTNLWSNGCPVTRISESRAISRCDVLSAFDGAIMKGTPFVFDYIEIFGKSSRNEHGFSRFVDVRPDLTAASSAARLPEQLGPRGRPAGAVMPDLYRRNVHRTGCPAVP